MTVRWQPRGDLWSSQPGRPFVALVRRARRGLFETPMMRQAVGPADSRLDEMVRVIKDYKIDVVVWPNHMGHKETQAVYGIIREICRELAVPVLDIGMDVFDNRYTTADEIKDKFTNFFRAMELG